MKRISRQKFLTLLAWASASLQAVLMGLLSFRFLFPNVTYGSSTVVKIGKPEDLPPDAETFLRDSRLFIASGKDGMRVMSAACTHLGCAVGKVEWGYQCPCHGSKFDSAGRVLAGPAPRPLPWFKILRGPDGQLVVDTSREVPRGTFFKSA